MSFLDDLNLDTVDGSAIDYSIANGVYPAFINSSELVDNQKKPGMNNWRITYKLAPDVETYGGRTVSEFFDLDPSLPDDRKAWLKRRLVSLGFDDEDMKTLEPADVIGIEVMVTVKNRKVGDNTYTNVTKVELGHATVEDDSFPF